MNLSFNFLGTSESGELSAYAGRFTGFYTPRGMFGSPDAYYYSVDHESYETAASYKTELNFEFNTTTIQEPQTSLVFSGSKFGGRYEEGSTSLSFTGRQSSGLMDIPNYIIGISGFLTSYYDLSDVNLSIKGSNQTSHPDSVSAFVPIISGGLSSDIIDISTISNLISGSFYKYEKDDIILGALITGISWRRGYVKETLNLGTGECLLGVNISNIFYSRAGG